MFWAFAMTMFVGIASVLQGGFNRQIALSWGVAGAVMFNTLVYTSASLLLCLLAKKYPMFLPELLRMRGSLSQWAWWYLLPGICGFVIVVSAPILIAKIGAFPFMMGLVAAQLIASLCWDAVVEGAPVTLLRLCGAALAMAGVILVMARR